MYLGMKLFTSFDVFVVDKQTGAIHALRFFFMSFGSSKGLHSTSSPDQPSSSRNREFEATSPIKIDTIYEFLHIHIKHFVYAFATVIGSCLNEDTLKVRPLRYRIVIHILEVIP